MKRCTRCGEDKPESEFYSNRTKEHHSPLRPECKSCTKARVRTHQQERTEYMRSYRQRQRDGEQ